MGAPDEEPKKKPLPLRPYDEDIESLTPSMRDPTSRRYKVENCKYLLVYVGLFFVTLGVLATVAIAIWLLVRELLEKAEKKQEAAGIDAMVNEDLPLAFVRLFRA